MTRIKHGFSPANGRTPTYKTWRSMLDRCKSVPLYAGRGIAVCEEWKQFENFLRDMGVRPEGKSLDRIDNYKGYYKENCRWATRQEQADNRRYHRLISYAGETMSLAQWTRRLGMKKQTLQGRLKRGNDLFAPVRTWNAKAQ